MASAAAERVLLHSHVPHVHVPQALLVAGSLQPSATLPARGDHIMRSHLPGSVLRHWRLSRCRSHGTRPLVAQLQLEAVADGAQVGEVQALGSGVLLHGTKMWGLQCRKHNVTYSRSAGVMGSCTAHLSLLK